MLVTPSPPTVSATPEIGGHQVEAPDDVLVDRRRRIGRGHEKGVILIEEQLAAPAHDRRTSSITEPEAAPGALLAVDGHRLVRAEAAEDRRERRDDEAVLRAAEERAAPRDGADHLEGLAQDGEDRAERVFPAEEVVGHVRADEADRGLLLLLGLAVEAPRRHLDPLDLKHTRGQPANLNAAGDGVAPLEPAHVASIAPTAAHSRLPRRAPRGSRRTRSASTSTP